MISLTLTLRGTDPDYVDVIEAVDVADAIQMAENALAALREADWTWAVLIDNATGQEVWRRHRVIRQ